MQTAPSTADTLEAKVPSPIVRAKVRDLLMQSEAYRKLPAATQRQVARDTARTGSSFNVTITLCGFSSIHFSIINPSFLPSGNSTKMQLPAFIFFGNKLVELRINFLLFLIILETSPE